MNDEIRNCVHKTKNKLTDKFTGKLKIDFMANTFVLYEQTTKLFGLIPGDRRMIFSVRADTTNDKLPILIINDDKDKSLAAIKCAFTNFDLEITYEDRLK